MSVLRGLTGALLPLAWRYPPGGAGWPQRRSSWPSPSPVTTPPHIVALILEIRRERQSGPLRIRFLLERYHQVYVSASTIYRILKQHRAPRVSLKRYRAGVRRRREIPVPGQSVQVDVKHLMLDGRRFYQFTAIDEATRYRVLRLYAHNSIRWATDFVEEGIQPRPVLPLGAGCILIDRDVPAATAQPFVLAYVSALSVCHRVERAYALRSLSSVEFPA